jgi:chromosome segregation ATPase
MKDSKGNIYNSCPYINSIQDLCKQQKEIIDQIISELEKVRTINEELRKSAVNKSDVEQEVWETVGDLIGVRRCDEWDLKSYVSDKEKEIKDLEEEKEKLENEISDLTSKNEELLDEIKDLKNE